MRSLEIWKFHLKQRNTLNGTNAFQIKPVKIEKIPLLFLGKKKISPNFTKFWFIAEVNVDRNVKI